MTRDEIIRIALEAGCLGPGKGGDPNGLWEPNGWENVTELMLNFAALVTAAEREACLTMVKDILAGYRADIIWQDGFNHNLQHPIQAITAAFKERGEK
jgi:hypothetical protein